MYKVIMTVKEDRFSALGLDPCQLEDELDKVRGRQGGDRPGGRGQRATRDPFISLVSKDLISVCPERERGEVSAQTSAPRSAEPW